MTQITVSDLTEATLAGTGVFDVLMRANKAHLEAEFSKGRIKGAEYSTVYLGSLESVMRTALEFLMQREKISLEALLLEQQITLTEVQVRKAEAELAILQLNLTKVPFEIAHLQAQTALVGQQTDNLQAEALNIPKVGCKLDAEYDLLITQKQKVLAENVLLVQKTATEKAQIHAAGVDDNSVVGRQKLLYKAQTDGFARDAEQKVADIMVKTWSVRRTTDEGTGVENNNLNDYAIGRAVSKLMEGIGA